MARVAFIGLGHMGGGMAPNLAKAGHDVRAFDLSQEALAHAVEHGCKRAKSAAEACKNADAVVTMLPAGKHVAEVFLSSVFGAAPKTAILMDCSTIDVATAKAVEAEAQEKGYTMVDAPASGGIAAAEGGTLTFMVGGSDQAFERAKPILEKMGKTIVHAGGAGAGHKVKLVYNFLAMGSAALVCESLAACARTGLDLDMFYRLVSAGGANSSMFQMVVPKALQGDLTGLQFTLGNAQKDIGYYQQFTAAARLPGPMGAALMQTLVQANALGLGEKYVASLIEAHEKINAMQVVKH
jgi:3-hydroxyisobutyrate dehydrogenase